MPDLAPLREEIAALRAELRDSAIDLPEGASPYRVLDQVSEAITHNGLSVYDTSHRDPKHYARFSVTPVEVEFNTNFERAFDVLRKIESSDKTMRIERLELTGSSDEATGHVGVSLEISSFFLRGEREGGQR